MDHHTTVNSPSLFEALARHRGFVAAVVIGAAVVGAVVATAADRTNTATAAATLADPAEYVRFGPTTNVTAAEFDRLMELERSRADSAEVYELAAERLGGNLTAEEINDMTTVTRDDNARLSFTVTSDDAREALELADTAVIAYRDVKSEAVAEQTEAALSAIDAELESLQQYAARIEEDEPGGATALRSTQDALTVVRQRSSEVRIDAAAIGDGVLLVKAAVLEPPTSGARLAAIGAILAGLLALTLGTMVAWFATSRRPTVRDHHVPAGTLGIPLLGHVPSPTASRRRQRGPAAPIAYQLVASAISARVDKGVFVLAGSSESGAESAQLAATFTRDSRRVVLVDAHTDGNGASTVVGLDTDEGIADLLRQAPDRPILRQDLMSMVRRVDIGSGQVIEVIADGNDPSELEHLMRTRSFASAVELMREFYELVIIDAGSLLTSTTAGSAAREADGIIVVVRDGTPIEDLEEVRHVVEVLSAPALGYVYSTRAHRTPRFQAVPKA